MISLDGTQTVNDICRSCMRSSSTVFTDVNRIVNVHLEHGRTQTYHVDDARVNCVDDARVNCIVYRMEIWVDSNAVVLDLYNY